VDEGLKNREQQARNVPAGELGGRLEGLTLGRQVWALALWPFLEQVLGFFTSFTDMFIAGRMGAGMEVAPLLEALAVAAFVGWLIFIVQGAIATGATALIARSTGAQDAAFANKVVGQTATLSCIVGLLLGGMLGFAAETLAGGLFGLKGEALEAAVKYLVVIAWAAPFSALVSSLNAALRGAGDTHFPFIVMLVVNIVNVIMSLLFVFGPEPIGGMGVDGLALGTVIGWVIGAIIALVRLLKPREEKLGELTLTLPALKVDLETAWRILRIGLPTALEISVIWMIQVAIARYISSLPAEGALGSHMMAIRLESMSFLPGFAIGIAASTLAGQYLGAKNATRAREAIIYCWKAAFVIMSALGLSLIFFAEWWVRLIAPDSPELVKQAVPLTVIGGFMQPLMATTIVLRTAMRGAGDTKRVMFWSFSNQIFWRVIVMWTLISLYEIGLFWIWIIVSIDLMSQTISFAYLFFQGKWQTAKV